jgi:hypothetical protein
MLRPNLPPHLLENIFEMISFFRKYKTSITDISQALIANISKALRKEESKEQLAYLMNSEELWETLDNLSDDITNWQIDTLVGLSPNSLVITSMLKAKRKDSCNIYSCERTAKNTVIPVMCSDHELIKLDDNSNFLVPTSLFNLNKTEYIVLVDNFLLTGITAGFLKRALKEKGFENIRYITLVELESHSEEGRILPDAIGRKLKEKNITFPWEVNTRK